MTRFQKIIVGASLLIALGIRINAVLQEKATVLRGDATSYDEIAMSLALGKGYRYGGGAGELTASRVPLYPLFLAGIYRTVGHNYRAARMAQAILSAITVLLIALWADILFGGWSAPIAAFIASIYPVFYDYYFSCPALITETLYTFMFTAALYTFYAYWTRPWWLLGVISGFFWGLVNLTRPVSLPLLAVLPVILILLRYPFRQVIRYTGTVWLMVLLTMAPWMIRNYLLFRDTVAVSTDGPVNLYLAFHPNNWDGIGANTVYEDYLPEEHRLEALGMPEAERANYFLRKGLGFIRDDPAHASYLIFRRILLYMDPRTTLFHKEDKRQIITWGYLFVLAGTVIGFFLSLKYKIRRREIFSLVLIFSYFVLFHGFMAASERYRFPNEPILIVITSFVLNFLIQRKSKLNLETARK